MNCLSLNICCTQTYKKRSLVNSICLDNKVSFLGLQETRMTKVGLFKIKSMWGTASLILLQVVLVGGQFAFSLGPQCVVKRQVFCTHNAIVVEGTWVSLNFSCFMVNVHTPQDLASKCYLWAYLLGSINQNDGMCVLFRDFNVVREPLERFGSFFCPIAASALIILLMLRGL